MGFGYSVQRHFQQYLNYIMAVSFVGVRKQEYPEKRTSHNVVSSTPRNERTLVVI